MLSDTEDSNLAIGFQALGGSSLAGGEDNVAIGNHTLQSLEGADLCVAVGYNAGNDIVNGSGNNLFGYAAGSVITSGSNNTACGRAAGSTTTSGDNNVHVGYNAGTSSSPHHTTNESNRIVLGNNSTTDIYCADTSISSSDQRDKTDVENFTHGLNYIEQLVPKTYRWDKRSWYAEDDLNPTKILEAKPDGSKKRNKLHIGFMAQDVQAIEEALGHNHENETNLVFNKNDDIQCGLKYERLVPILVNAVKELSAEIKALKGE